MCQWNRLQVLQEMRRCVSLVTLSPPQSLALASSEQLQHSAGTLSSSGNMKEISWRKHFILQQSRFWTSSVSEWQDVRKETCCLLFFFTHWICFAVNSDSHSDLLLHDDTCGVQTSQQQKDRTGNWWNGNRNILFLFNKSLTFWKNDDGNIKRIITAVTPLPVSSTFPGVFSCHLDVSLLSRASNTEWGSWSASIWTAFGYTHCPHTHTHTLNHTHTYTQKQKLHPAVLPPYYVCALCP